MKRNPVETVLGAIVLAIAGLFLWFAITTGDLRTVKGYEVTASFLKVGGLETGSDVRIGGIKIGSVVGQSLDPERFEAVLTLSIAPEIRLPDDTEASIVSDGLLGGKYVKLAPGSSATMLAAGAALTRTQDFQALEDLIGEIIFLATDRGETSP